MGIRMKGIRRKYFWRAFDRLIWPAASSGPKLPDFSAGTSPAAYLRKADPKLLRPGYEQNDPGESPERRNKNRGDIPDSIFVSPERQQISGIRFGQVSVQNMEMVIRPWENSNLTRKKLPWSVPRSGLDRGSLCGLHREAGAERATPPLQFTARISSPPRKNFFWP